MSGVASVASFWHIRDTFSRVGACLACSVRKLRNSMTALGLIIACGLLAILYGIWAITSVMAADAGSARMQEIAAAVREGAQAYLKRQYTTIGIVGIVIFLIVGWLLGWLVALGFAIGALLSGAAGFIGMHVLVRATSPAARPP